MLVCGDDQEIGSLHIIRPSVCKQDGQRRIFKNEFRRAPKYFFAQQAPFKRTHDQQTRIDLVAIVQNILTNIA